MLDLTKAYRLACRDDRPLPQAVSKVVLACVQADAPGVILEEMGSHDYPCLLDEDATVESLSCRYQHNAFSRLTGALQCSGMAEDVYAALSSDFSWPMHTPA